MLNRIHELNEEQGRAEANAKRLRRRLLATMRKARAEHTLQEIGDALGVSRQRVDQLLKPPTEKGKP